MNKLTLYECEICHTNYNNIVKAEECETKHEIPKKILSYKYKPITMVESGLPTSITIDFGSGEKHTYHI